MAKWCFFHHETHRFFNLVLQNKTPPLNERNLLSKTGCFLPSVLSRTPSPKITVRQSSKMHIDSKLDGICPENENLVPATLNSYRSYYMDSSNPEVRFVHWPGTGNSLYGTPGTWLYHLICDEYTFSAHLMHNTRTPCYSMSIEAIINSAPLWLYFVKITALKLHAPSAIEVTQHYLLSSM